MYKCDLCGTTVPPRTPCRRIVVDTRPKQYPFRKDAFRSYDRRSGRRTKGHQTADRGGSGWEIAREVIACPACAETYRQEVSQVAPGPKRS